MDHQSLLDRILKAVDDASYLTAVSHVDPRQREAMRIIDAAQNDPNVPADHVRALIDRMHREGRIDRVMYLSAMHVLAAGPKVQDYAEAARLAGEQELAALELGGPNLDDNLAAVDRHRGVLAYLRGHYEVALDYFTRALERQRSAMNLANVMASLIRVGEEREARALRAQIRASFPAAIVAELEQFVATDPDLALLRTEE